MKNVKDVRETKKKLERNILELMKGFEKETHFVITEAEFRKTEVDNGLMVNRLRIIASV